MFNNSMKLPSSAALAAPPLIIASVAIRPDRDGFSKPSGPLDCDRVYLDPYYELAIAELGVRVEPLDHSDKMAAQRIAAERLAYRAHVLSQL